MITTLKDDGLSQKAKELSEMLAAGGKPIETNADGARQLITYGAPGVGKSQSASLLPPTSQKVLSPFEKDHHL